MLSDKIISRIKNNSDFILLRDYILEEISALNSVDGLGDMDNARAGEEAKVRLLAAKRIVGILNPILGFNEKKEYTAEDYKKAKSRHGL